MTNGFAANDAGPAVLQLACMWWRSMQSCFKIEHWMNALEGSIGHADNV